MYKIYKIYKQNNSDFFLLASDDKLLLSNAYSSHCVHIQFCLEGAQFEAQRGLLLSQCKSQTNLNLFQQANMALLNLRKYMLNNQGNIQRGMYYISRTNLKSI